VAEAGLSDENEAETVTARLEQALERIAILAAAPMALVANPANSADQSLVDVTVVAGRLDALIAQVRGALTR